MPARGCAGTGAGRAARAARVVIDSREAGPGDLFVGLPGESHDGGAFARGRSGRGRVGRARRLRARRGARRRRARAR